MRQVPRCRAFQRRMPPGSPGADWENGKGGDCRGRAGVVQRGDGAASVGAWRRHVSASVGGVVVVCSVGLYAALTRVCSAGTAVEQSTLCLRWSAWGALRQPGPQPAAGSRMPSAAHSLLAALACPSTCRLGQQQPPQQPSPLTATGRTGIILPAAGRRESPPLAAPAACAHRASSTSTAVYICKLSSSCFSLMNSCSECPV